MYSLKVKDVGICLGAAFQMRIIAKKKKDIKMYKMDTKKCWWEEFLWRLSVKPQ